MGKLALIGAVLLSGHGHLTHHQRYWWPASNSCTISTVEKNGTLRAVPYIQCVAVPAHFGSTPPPTPVGFTPTQVTQSAANYNPFGNNGY